VRAAVHTRLGREESGFTLVELLVGMLILVIGILGLTEALDHSRSLATSAEHLTAVTDVAEQAIEEMSSLPYTATALPCDPRPAPTSPAATRCATTNTESTSVLYRGTDGLAEALVVDAARSTFAALPTDWSDARTGTRGKIYRFVTCTDAALLSNCTLGTSPKRITVAATVTQGSPRPERPVILETLMTDPTLGDPSVPGSPCAGTGICQEDDE
jgi:prepilin-type N-terminal cleavage/methylation domain-containing protein